MTERAATLFDLREYHQELAPDPNAPYSLAVMSGFVAESVAEHDGDRLNRLFAYLCMRGELYSESDYQRIHAEITAGFKTVDEFMTAQLKETSQ